MVPRFSPLGCGPGGLLQQGYSGSERLESKSIIAHHQIALPWFAQKELLPLSGAPEVDLITLHTNPVLTVVNFGKIISDNPADRGRQGLPSRRRRANLYFAAFFEIDGGSDHDLVALLDAAAELDLCRVVAELAPPR